MFMTSAPTEKTAAGSLFIVATPIGHMADMTERAREVLAAVDLVACEDTRETQKLLKHYSIQAKCVAYHAQSSERAEQELLNALAGGQDVALLSDRGTPGISDPGSRLVRRAVEAGLTVVPIPGATAVITALQAAGVDTSEFWFRGFIPHKKGRQTFLTTAIAHEGTVVFYESPHRILKCLTQAIDLEIGERHMVVARELTKLHEEFLRGSAATILEELSSRPTVQGEYVVIFDAL